MPSLKLSTYKPNFTDPRVRRRVEKVMAYCKGMVDYDTTRDIFAKDIRKLFGNTSEPGLSQWLYANLMTQEFFYKRGEYGHPYAYRVRPEGYRKVLKMLQDSAQD